MLTIPAEGSGRIGDVAYVEGCWYARDVFALLAHPTIPSALRAELHSWVAMPDVHVRTRRPFAVLPDGMYSFDWRYRQRHGAPAWWVAAAQAWVDTAIEHHA